MIFKYRLMDIYGYILKNKGDIILSKYDRFIVTSQYKVEEIQKDNGTSKTNNRALNHLFIYDLLNSDFLQFLFRNIYYF